MGLYLTAIWSPYFWVSRELYYRVHPFKRDLSSIFEGSSIWYKINLCQIQSKRRVWLQIPRFYCLCNSTWYNSTALQDVANQHYPLVFHPLSGLHYNWAHPKSSTPTPTHSGEHCLRSASFFSITMLSSEPLQTILQKQPMAKDPPHCKKNPKTHHLPLQVAAWSPGASQDL